MSSLEDRLHEALTGDDPGRTLSPDLFARVVGSIDDDRRRRRHLRRTATAWGVGLALATAGVTTLQREGIGMPWWVLEIATTLGGLAGALTAVTLSHRTLSILFGVVALGIAAVMFRQIDRRTSLADPEPVTGWLGGQYYSPDHGSLVGYRVKRLPLALGMSFLAGNVSGLLGIGGGILKVPTLNAWCGVPMRAAAATTAAMIGVTALGSAPIYYARGRIVAPLAAAAVLGVLAGSRIGNWMSPRTKARWLIHKLATWIDQFGICGCVGCGRCITWCPVGIDLTEEVAALRGESA